MADKFCAACGGSLETAQKDGKNRLVCASCGKTTYRNARNVTGTIPLWDDHVLLCRRAIEPQAGLWTLPSGFMETNETSLEAAQRETREEAFAEVDVGPLFNLIELPHLSQVHFFYLAKLRNQEFRPGPESSEVRLFPINDIPWDEIAFGTVRETLKKLLAEWPYPTTHHMEIHAHSHDSIDELLEHTVMGPPTLCQVTTGFEASYRSLQSDDAK